jgi:hypothetical protein
MMMKTILILPLLPGKKICIAQETTIILHSCTVYYMTPYYELNIVYYGYGIKEITITTRKMIIGYQVTYLYTLS